MRKGPLIAAGIIFALGLVQVIVGGIYYTPAPDPATWGTWLLWIGLIFINISLIVMVIAFIKKLEEKETTEEEA